LNFRSDFHQPMGPASLAAHWKYFFSLAETLLRPVLLAACSLGLWSCQKPNPAPAARPAPLSSVTVTVTAGGPAVMKSGAAEFSILPSGYVQACLLKDGSRLVLDEPGAGATASGDYLLSSGKEIRDFTLDFSQVKISEAAGKLGALGKRVEISGRASTSGVAGLKKRITVEVYDDFPTMALMTVSYQNAGEKEISIDQVVAQRHRLNASLANPQAAPHELWSFQGSSYDWGLDEILPLTRIFFRSNLMGGPGEKGQGGGIPVVDFWTAQVGEAIGHLENQPLVLSLPVKVEGDGRLNISMRLEPRTTLKSGDTYTTPLSFVLVHEGDFYNSLRLWSSALQHQKWTLPKPTSADFAANWCGWGYEADFTPAQMLGTIPKLKEMGIQWATLDYCWFDSFGDWKPRKDRFPGDSIKGLVDEFHRQGIKITLWWQPLGVEDGQGKPSLGKPMTTANVVREHPDWMILDKSGHRARLVSPVCTVAALCPALPEVQAYHRQLTETFLRDWGFDGSKIDSAFSVPPCYNPSHHHKSPHDSIYAMADLYRIIFETTRALKPESVTQICPCGTTPNLAWLPFMDQAVTADPVGSVQVRRRIKMYKALLGPESAVYGDHVELSGIKKRVGNDWLESGTDFASTIGPGGVIGTKFTWPGDAPDPTLRKVKLTPEKEVAWKKWISLYNAKMLSRGTFRNLYVHGYDVPESYAIEKEGIMYYAFFSPDPQKKWQGEIELRGLKPGQYRVVDYEKGAELGVLDPGKFKLPVEFQDHLLLEVSGR
jgi:alpha-galactosidase